MLSEPLLDTIGQMYHLKFDKKKVSGKATLFILL